MSHAFSVRVGPRGFRVTSPWSQPLKQLQALYAGYPKPDGDIADHSVRLEAPSLFRRFFRPAVAINGDYMIPEAVPLPLSMGLLAAEMGMNLQIALGERHFLLLHAATVEKGGKALILTGESGSGKSTMSAVLMCQGWRLLGDEFALVDPDSGLIHPFPRPISLKNAGAKALDGLVKDNRFGPLMKDTPKGDLRHLTPDAASIASMGEPAQPALLLFPAFGHSKATRPVGQGEVFVRLTQASTNYTALGERGFSALTRLVRSIPAHAIDYPDTRTGVRLVEQLWESVT
jgi:HprK-related kinase A